MKHLLRGCAALVLTAITVCGATIAQADITGKDQFGGFESPSSPNGFPAKGTGPEFHTGFAKTYAASHPGLTPIGVNDFSCKPRAGENPIILIPGTTAEAFGSWAMYGPHLAKLGLCVYSFNYNPSQNPVNEAQGFSGDIKASAAFLATIVDKVLASTGASKVDLIGHSQGGGPLPRAYIKWFGGKDKVGKLIGLTPSNMGTTMGGLNKLLENQGIYNIFSKITEQRNMTALTQQLVNSTFMQELNSGPLLYPGIEYTVISTTADGVVTPYTNAFLPGAHNMTVQDFCPANMMGHPDFTYDGVAFQLVIQTLKPELKKPIKCVWWPDYLPKTTADIQVEAAVAASGQ